MNRLQWPVGIAVWMLAIMGCAAPGRIEVYYGRMPSPGDSFDCNVKGTLFDLGGRPMGGVVVELRQGKRRLVTWTRDLGSFCFTGVPPGHYDIYYWGLDPNQSASETVHGVFVRPLVKTSIRAWADVNDGEMLRYQYQRLGR